MEPRQASQVTTGLVIIAIGLIMFAGQTDFGSIHLGKHWPVIFLILGVGKLLGRAGLANALWMFFLGGIFYMHTYRLMSLRESWPLFIVAGGLSFMLCRDDGHVGSKQSSGSEPPKTTSVTGGGVRP
jgi:hypothetical protein